LPAEGWAADLETGPMSRAEAADFDLDQMESDARLDEKTIVKIAEVFSILAQQWLLAHYEALHTGARDLLRDALETATHDAIFITVKLRRALEGRDRCKRSED